MAALINACRTVGAVREYKFQQIICLSVRHATHKTGTAGKVQQNARPPKFRTYIRRDGDFVIKGGLLYKQLNMRYHPGLNVKLVYNAPDNDWFLASLVDGTVVVSSEKVNPNPSHPVVQKMYGDRPAPVYKKFYNVIPEPDHKKFNLVDLI